MPSAVPAQRTAAAGADVSLPQPRLPRRIADRSQARRRTRPRAPGPAHRHRQPAATPPDPTLSPHWTGEIAPYKPPAAVLPGWVAGAAALTLVGGLFVWCLGRLNAASDTVFNRMLEAPLAHMPQIARLAPVKAAPTAAATGRSAGAAVRLPQAGDRSGLGYGGGRPRHAGGADPQPRPVRLRQCHRRARIPAFAGADRGRR